MARILSQQVIDLMLKKYDERDSALMNNPKYLGIASKVSTNAYTDKKTEKVNPYKNSHGSK